MDHKITYDRPGREGERWCETCDRPVEDDHGPPDSALADVDLLYRGRGRPRLPEALRRREKLVVSLTPDEKRRVMVAAAKDTAGPMGPQDWARKKLLELAPPVNGES